MSGHNSRRSPEEGTNSYGEKDFEKNESFKMRVENVIRKVNKQSRIRI